MDAQTVLYAKTAQLCQQLGSVEAQLCKLAALKSQILSQLDALDAVAPALKPQTPPPKPQGAPKMTVVPTNV